MFTWCGKHAWRNTHYENHADLFLRYCQDKAERGARCMPFAMASQASPLVSFLNPAQTLVRALLTPRGNSTSIISSGRPLGLATASASPHAHSNATGVLTRPAHKLGNIAIHTSLTTTSHLPHTCLTPASHRVPRHFDSWINVQPVKPVTPPHTGSQGIYLVIGVTSQAIPHCAHL